MSRQLASIQRITAIDPIEGADRIEVASVLGWKVVVKKDEFQVGDLALYLEIDSIPPDEPMFRFLWKNTEVRPNNFRIKTVKLRGQISQGILFPIHSWGPDGVGTWWVGQEGDDMTDVVRVTKYEAPLPGGSTNIEGQFFDGVPKTDEDRVQSRHDLVAALRGRPYYITTKCDGASMTIASHEGEVKVASRNYRLSMQKDSSYWAAALADDEALVEFVRTYPFLAVQGELVGPGIQGNKMLFSDHRCLVFNIFDRTIGEYLSLAEVLNFAQMYGFYVVPVIEVGHLFNYTPEQLLTLAEAKYECTSNEREGIVVRSNDGARPRISFKAISNRFLLKGGD